MSVKIGIVTILKVNNYGAELQAFATQKFLQGLGFDAEIVDYLFYKNAKHKRTRLSKPSVNCSLAKIIKERLYPLYTKLKALKYNAAHVRRCKHFERFHARHTRQSTCYRTLDELKAADLDYDILLAGSDQIWNPGNYTSLDPYFLLFGPHEAKRIAYASSFGVSEVPPNAKEYYQNALQQFYAIGVREDAAVELVRKLSGKEAQLVLDPTLLLPHEQWMEVANPVTGLPEEPFILIYELGDVPYIKHLALHISELTGMPIVRICQNAVKKDNEKQILNIIDAGPAEFLFIFDKAGIVLTNSFHGSAFSINFGKQFFTIVPKHKPNNSRQISLLKLFSCTSRLLKEGEEYPQLDNPPIEYSIIETRLKEERQKSINFLIKAIHD